MYISWKENWAKCFRTGEFGNVHNNLFIESFHNQLKTIYFEGKRNRSVNVLVDTLNEFNFFYSCTFYEDYVSTCLQKKMYICLIAIREV